jgi:hypothetical protein
MGVGWGVACANPLCVECVLGAYCFGDGNYLPICDSFSVVCVVALCISVVCLPSVWKSRKGGGCVGGIGPHRTSGNPSMQLTTQSPAEYIHSCVLPWVGRGRVLEGAGSFVTLLQ